MLEIGCVGTGTPKFPVNAYGWGSYIFFYFCLICVFIIFLNILLGHSMEWNTFPLVRGYNKYAREFFYEYLHKLCHTIIVWDASSFESIPEN